MPQPQANAMTIHSMSIGRDGPLALHDIHTVFFLHFAHAVRIELLLHDSLCGDNLCETLQSRGLEPTRRVGLKCRYHTRFRDLVWSGVFHVYGLEKQDV